MFAIPRRSETWWLLAIVASGLLLRGAAMVLYSHVPESDELAYLAMARNLVAGHGLLDGAGNRAMYNMGYPFFIVAPTFVVAGSSLVALRCVNALLGAVSILLCHALACEAGANRAGRLLAAALWALYLPAALYSVYVAKENLMIPLMLGVLWCSLRLVDSASLGLALLCGFLSGLLALTGNAALCLLLPTAVALLWRAPKDIARWKAAALLLAALALTTAPWLWRNHQVLGSAVLNTNGGFNLYLGNNERANGMYLSIADTPRGPGWQALRASGEVAASQALRNDALDWVARHPLRFGQLALVKLRLFWTPPWHDGIGVVSTAERVLRLAWLIQFLLLCGAALSSLVFGVNRRVALLWLALLAYSGVHMIFYVIFRYREPVMPVVCILAALGLTQAWRRFFGRKG